MHYLVYDYPFIWQPRSIHDFLDRRSFPFVESRTPRITMFRRGAENGKVRGREEEEEERRRFQIFFLKNDLFTFVIG